MCEIVKTYKQKLPATRFVGIKYGDEDRVEGSFAHLWGHWFQTGLFTRLEELITDEFKEAYEDFDAYTGLMRWKDGEKFQYWIGMFLPQETIVPEGYDYIDFIGASLGVCWIHGSEPEIYCNEEKCAEKLSEEGYEVVTDDEGAWWFFERYGCPRFTNPDENGRVILDICHFVK